MTKNERIKMVESRLEIVSELYKRAYTYREIQREVISRLNLKSYSLKTVKEDIERLLSFWREQEVRDVDDRVRLELARIDEAVRELWEQWEKSKRDYTRTSSKRKREPVTGGKKKEGRLKTLQQEETETEVIRLGDVSYMAEIRAQLAERRKLLGLYESEKVDVSVSIPTVINIIKDNGRRPG